MQIELLDRKLWSSRAELVNGIFEWIEAWYNPQGRHSAIGYRSPIDYETGSSDLRMGDGLAGPGVLIMG